MTDSGPDVSAAASQHTYWSRVETVRTPDGPRQKTLCYLGELNGSAQARWLKTIEVFNEEGEAQQFTQFPSHVEVPEDDPVPLPSIQGIFQFSIAKF